VHALHKYYANDSTVVEELAKHIMDSREEQIKETIKRKIQVHPLLGKVEQKST
jgi:hypothetical protein